MSTWHMKVRVIRVFWVPDYDTRNKFEFCTLLPENPKWIRVFRVRVRVFRVRVSGFLPSPSVLGDTHEEKPGARPTRSYPCQRASVGLRLRPWVGAAGWGGRIGRRPGRRTGRPATAKMMVCAWCETPSWTCNSHCAGRWGWCRTNTGRRRLLPRPLSRMRGAEAEAWGEREMKHMTNEVAATEARTIIIVRRYRWSNVSCLAGWSGARSI
jgi:hypothetical protein